MSYNNKIDLFNKLNFIYFSMNIYGHKNEETNIIKKICKFPNEYKYINESIIFNNTDNILAIKTGKINNLFVIDIDDLNNDISIKLNNICNLYCKYRVSTRKGFHYYFSYDERLNKYEKQSKASNINNSLGFDTRGDGGIIFYGSYKLGSITYEYKILDDMPELINMNFEIFEYVEMLLNPDKKINNNNDDVIISNKKKQNLILKYDGIINKISINDMLKYIECLNDDHFKSFSSWSTLYFMCYNCNNDYKIINQLWQRSQIGKYKDVTFDECLNKFASSGYIENFNINSFINLCKKDNYNNNFNKYFLTEYDTIDFEYNTINSDYLNYDYLKEYFDKTKYCVLKSAYGTGKTTFIQDLIIKEYMDIDISKPKFRVLFLVMRQSLANDLYNNFQNLGFTNYMDKKDFNYKTDKLIISIDSIKKITYKYLDQIKIKSYNLVICDEFCSLLNHLDFNAIKDVEHVYNIFKQVIKSSDKTYFMDGDISNREVKLLKNYFDYVDIPLFNINVKKKININLSYNQEKYFKLIEDDLKANKNIIIASMTSKFCDDIYERYNRNYKVFIIKGKSDDDIKKQIKDIDTLFIKYQIVIYSPTISVGVSFDVIHFHSIYGFIGDSISPREFYQMLFRCRKYENNNINILVDLQIKDNNKPFINIIDIKTELYDDDYIINDFEYIKLWNLWEQTNKKNFIKTFKAITINKGFIFNFDDNKDVKIKKTPSQVINNILNKPLISYNEFLLLCKKIESNQATENEKYTVEKYIYFTKFKLDDDITEKNFKNFYYKKLHILKGYLYNKYNDLNKNIDSEALKTNIYNNIKDSTNKKELIKNKKYNAYNEINNIIEKLDISYYSNKFDKNIIKSKKKYFDKLTKIMKIKNNIVDKDILTDRKDDLMAIFNDSKYRLLYNTDILKKDTHTALLGALNTCYNNFGVDLNYKRVTINNIRSEYLMNEEMACIPEYYKQYNDYVLKYTNNDLNYMDGFSLLINNKKDIKKDKKKEIDNFIIDF